MYQNWKFFSVKSVLYDFDESIVVDIFFIGLVACIGCYSAIN